MAIRFAPVLAGCATVTNQNAIVKSEFIFETAPFPSCHASTIAETKSGLVAAWFGGTAERNPDVCIYVSRNENGKWTPPDESRGWRRFCHQSFPDLESGFVPAEKRAAAVVLQSRPKTRRVVGHDDDFNRRRENVVEAACVCPKEFSARSKTSRCNLPNGDILCGSSTEGDGWKVHFERTSDFGKTWTATPPVNDGKKIGAIQPSILFLEDGSLEAIGRTHNDKIFQIFSHDDGKTWGEMSLTDLPNPDSGTDAVTLRDGRQLLVYNHNVRTGSNNKGRSPLNVAVSPDGTNWFAALVLEDDPNAPNGFAYPAVIQTSDGLVHITYTWERKRIKHVVIDPAKLELRPMLNGEWPE